MITNDIQELFDGALGDERAAELFHGLSVSPERRADFQRHIALQGALQADRLASHLTNDEDTAIWGAISGLGVAASGAGSGYSIGWVVKPILFVLAGVVGYILGTTHFSTGSGDSGSVASTAVAPAASRLPLVAVVPVVVPPAEQSPALAANMAPRPAVSRSNADHRAPNMSDASSADASHDNATALAHGHGDGTIPANGASGNNASGNDANANDATANDRDMAARNATAHDRERNPRLASQSIPNDPAANTPKNDSLNGLSSGLQHQEQPDAQRRDISHADVVGRIDARTLTPDEVTRALANDNAARSLTPDEMARALASGNTSSPLDENTGRASALTSNGFEVGFGHLLGRFNRANAATLSDPHIDLSYRFINGSVGLGLRVGFGNMMLQSRKAVQEQGPDNSFSTRYNTVGEVKQMGVAELYGNYRLPISRTIAVSMEGTLGGSTLYAQAGGNVSLIVFVADRIGVHVGVGYSRYWYGTGLSSADLTHDGDAMAATALSAYRGDFFELRWGVLFHL